LNGRGGFALKRIATGVIDACRFLVRHCLPRRSWLTGRRPFRRRLGGLWFFGKPTRRRGGQFVGASVSVRSGGAGIERLLIRSGDFSTWRPGGRRGLVVRGLNNA
jgi:hypothetical protein